MEPSTLPLHLNFLNDASHLLRASAPETSAHLMSHHNKLMFLNDVEQNDVRRQHVCGACGHIMIPGQGTTLKFETEKALRRKGRSAVKTREAKPKDGDRRSGMRKLFSCGHCNHTTSISFPPAPPAVRRRAKAEKLTAANSQQVAAATAKPTTANSSSKKRAKNRKAGLQALLSQAKASSSGGRSLSLADFSR
ncbi:hypothetical protein CCHL11_01399 [Colletotrichum chlorophyti]|uniref:Uncharacterized protein n=1 Tax=Colletotrichum chlorophyti TaxID=708187 RepID=A0A1Q8RYG4_9PEZI|nr:hypothetical protein CCHL11_01399 [Colletotrichum chlorophyti]